MRKINPQRAAVPATHTSEAPGSDPAAPAAYAVPTTLAGIGDLGARPRLPLEAAAVAAGQESSGPQGVVKTQRGPGYELNPKQVGDIASDIASLNGGKQALQAVEELLPRLKRDHGLSTD
ncbi:TAL effector repeat-containing protein [Xanthomonas translucens]|uniref:TAL effector repeat-containing protein n=1 Tax=Xanthomonas campestris pv. translucens TaxID=343 RepID=UPI001F3B381C|nr:TAL effector repeat-containing protein [Xanthomonas translucens]UJB16802.1 TAL effector repeat-containing protein [Xanthomonas translucens pv. undulosa]